jgi:hypothetical protein
LWPCCFWRCSWCCLARKMLRHRVRRDTQLIPVAVAQFFSGGKPGDVCRTMPAIAVNDAMTLFPLRYFQARGCPRTHRTAHAPGQGRAGSVNASLIVSNPVGARQMVRQAIMAWLACETGRCPNPEVAQHLFNWYQYLATITKDERAGRIRAGHVGVSRKACSETPIWRFRNLPWSCMCAELENGPGRMSYYDKV